jgi:hypothetical protein
VECLDGANCRAAKETDWLTDLSGRCRATSLPLVITLSFWYSIARAHGRAHAHTHTHTHTQRERERERERYTERDTERLFSAQHDHTARPLRICHSLGLCAAIVPPPPPPYSNRLACSIVPRRSVSPIKPVASKPPPPAQSSYLLRAHDPIHRLRHQGRKQHTEQRILKRTETPCTFAACRAAAQSHGGWCALL